MTIGRLGCIGRSAGKQKLVSGIYSLDDFIARKAAKDLLTNFSYDGKFNALTQAGAAQGFGFSTDGTVLLVCTPGTRATAKITEWILSTPFDVTTAVYQSGRDFLCGDYDINTNCISLDKPNNAAYFAGLTNDVIWFTSYNTSAGACLIPTVSKFYFGAQDATPRSTKIKNYGYSMYYLGATNRIVYQYSLSSQFDITTASYTNKSLAVTQDTTPQYIDFNADGTKMYMLGSTSRALFSYTLPTPWDFIGATPDYSAPLSYNASAQAAAPRSVFIGDSGTKMYVLGYVLGSPTIYQYTLSTPYNQTTATYASKSLNVNARDTEPWEIFFSSDGTTMYLLGNTLDTISTFNLSTPWDLATAVSTYAQKGYSVATQVPATSFTSVFIGDSGTKMYALAGDTAVTDILYQYTLSTPWDVSTATYASKSFSVNTQDTTTQGIFFKPDGTKLYVIGLSTDAIYQYTLGTAWDISTATYDSVSLAVGSQETTPSGLFIDSSGTRLYITGGTGDDVTQYSLGTPWAINTATFVRVSAAVGDTLPQDLFFKDDGTKMYIIGSTGDAVREFNLSTAWNVSTISFVKTYSVGYLDALPTSIFFKSDGTEMYIAGYTNRVVYQLSLSVAWDSGSVTGRFFFGDQETGATAMYISPDGLNLYVIGNTGDDVNQYLLSVPWNVSTASYVRVSATIGDAEPRGIFFSNDGYKMIITGQTNDEFRQFDLSTPWDVSTATLGQTFYHGHLSTAASCVHFSPDGLYMYWINTTIVYRFTLHYPFQCNTVIGTFSVNKEETVPTAFCVLTDSSIFLTGQSGDDINRYVFYGSNLADISYAETSSGHGEATVTGIAVDEFNGRVYINGTTLKTIRRFSISGSLSSLVFVDSAAVQFEATSSGLEFSLDRLYMTGTTNDCVYGFPDPYTSGRFRPGSAGGYAYIGASEANVRSLSIPNGITSGASNNIFTGGSAIRKYTTPDEVIENLSLSQTFAITEPYGISVNSSVNNSSQRIYVALGTTAADKGGRSIRVIKFSSPNDLSTATLDTVEAIGAPGVLGNMTNLWNIYVTPDEMRMFVLSPTVQGIYQFSRKFL